MAANLDEDALRDMYYNQSLSKAEIARQLGVAPITVDKYFKKYGIKSKKQLLDEKLTKKLLYDLHIIQGRTMNDIAREFGVHLHTIKSKMLEYGIEIRYSSESRRPKKTTEREDSETIVKAYQASGNIAAVAKQLGISSQKVSDVLKLNGIVIEHGGGLPKQDIPREVLEELYVQQGKAAEEVAKILDVKANVVYARLEEYGIQSHRQSALSALTKELMYKLYVEENRNQEEIADMLGVGISTVQTALRRHNIEKDPSLVVTRREETCLDKYGYKNPGSVPDVQEKVKQTNMKMFGVENAAYKDIDHIDDWNNFKQYIADRYEHEGKLFHDDVCLYFNICRATLQKRIDSTEIQKFFNYAFSKPETEWKNWFDEQGIAYTAHNRKACKGYELDFYLDDYRMGIEINPSATHNSTRAVIHPSVAPKKTTYHKDKAEQCEIAGINLISVFDWYDDEKIKSIILANIGRNERIYARKTRVTLLDKKTEKAFMSENHLQGHVRSQICYGLYDESDRLVAAMSFGKARYGNKENADYELLRFCSLQGLTVVGGASKLFKHFIEDHAPQKVVSYCNYDISNGGMYRKLGFEYVRHTQPSYYWCDIHGRECYSWYLINAKGVDNVLGTNYGKGTKNDEIMTDLGYVKVFNSGNKVYVWTSQRE